MQLSLLNYRYSPAIKRANARKTSHALTLALFLQVMQMQRLRAEDQVDYRYAYYKENDGRMEVQTGSAFFDVTLKEGLIAVKGEMVHDALSGATPNGAAPPSKYTYLNIPGIPLLGNTNSTSVPLKHMQDVRNSISLEVPVTLGIHEVTPQASYSAESDYWSTGAALNYSLQLNEKNTTLNLGWAHSWDRVRDTLMKIHDKSSDDFLLGVNQLLGPKTVLGVNFTYGQANGYLNDPYRWIVGATDPQLDANNPAGTFEQRPSFKEKFIARVSVTQFITPVNASVEAAYRFYHDSFGINGQSVDLAWYQKLGKHVVLSPNFRYYYQTAANFYYEILPGSIYAPPTYFSSDYRLSQLQTFSVGLNLKVKATEWLAFDASYRFYTMQGLDGVTSQTAYPSANVFTVGARISF